MPTFVYMTQLRRLRTLRRHLSVRHHAHRYDLPPRLQHRAQYVLGVLLVREGLPAECDRRAAAMPTSRRSGHSVRVLREEEKATISWKIKFRDGREKDFVSPIRTTPWGSIKSPADYEAPDRGRDEVRRSSRTSPRRSISHALPALTPDQLKQGVL